MSLNVKEEHLPPFAADPDKFKDDFRIAGLIKEVMGKTEGLFVGADVLVISKGQDLAPAGFMTAELAVPEGYFDTLGLTAEQEVDLLRFLISGRLLSVKSKFSQAGIDQVWPNHKQGEPISSIPITRGEGTYRLPIEIGNSNPFLTLRFPKGQLPFLRFYLPTGRLYGADLYERALELSTDHQAVGLMNGSGLEMPLAEVEKLSRSDSRFDPKSNDQFVAVVLPIVRHGRFTERKVITAEDLAKPLARKDLDNLLGLSWQEEAGGEVEGWREYQISETVPVNFSKAKGLIIPGAERLPSKVGLSHSGSVVIDAGFAGPIRTEVAVDNWPGSPRVFPRRIGVFLHK